MRAGVLFSNKGTLDIRAIKTFGVSAKTSSSPIGMFGTGLKYAIAVCLRNGCSVSLRTGGKLYQFTSQVGEIRDKKFNFIYMNDEQLGFTTELGKFWKLWMAYRELYCNSLDEEDPITRFVNTDEASKRAESLFLKECDPDDSRTLIYVSGDNFVNVHASRHEFILASQPLPDLSNSFVEFHHRINPTNSQSPQGIFYRGIRVADEGEHPGMFTYNILADLELTEDRTIKYDFTAKMNITYGLVSCGNPDILAKALTCPDHMLEHFIDWGWIGHLQPQHADHFCRVFQTLSSDDLRACNASAIKMGNRGKKMPKPRVLEPTPMQARSIEKALQVICKLGFHSVRTKTIYVSDNLGSKTFGLRIADYPGEIFIDVKTFDMGTKYVASTILEEYIHDEYRYDDFTREFQDLILNRLISSGEELMNEPL